MVAVLAATMASSIVNTVFAAQIEGKQDGPKAQTNYRDCKDDFSEKQCKRLFTGSD